MEKFLTRQDAGLGEGLFDSIAWALEVHVKRADTGEFQSAVLVGNQEDSPERIEFFRSPDPNHDQSPDWVWYNE